MSKNINLKRYVRIADRGPDFPEPHWCVGYVFYGRLHKESDVIVESVDHHRVHAAETCHEVVEFDETVPEIPTSQIIEELLTLESSLEFSGQPISAGVCRDAANRLWELSKHEE